MSLFWWVAAGAVVLAGLIFCFRFMRRGLRTLDDERRKLRARIEEGEHKLAEEQKQVPAAEHLALMRAAVEDLLRLADSPAGHSIEAAGRVILLHTPSGTWRLELAMRERTLKATKQVVHGRCRWLLSGFGHQEQHEDHASLMRSLHGHLRAEAELPEEPPHLARRLAGARRTPAARADGRRQLGRA